jgi:hypothetical protein
MEEENKESTKDLWRFPRYLELERETVSFKLSK